MIKASSANAVPTASTANTPVSSVNSTILDVLFGFAVGLGQYFRIQYLSRPASEILTILQRDVYINNHLEEGVCLLRLLGKPVYIRIWLNVTVCVTKLLI